jgi:hypothetical protein
MTNATEATKERMCGPVDVYQGRCFKCDGVGWYYKGEAKKRGPNLGEQAAARAAADAALGITGRQRSLTVGHFDWNHTAFGRPQAIDADCLVCTEAWLPSEALALLFAPRDEVAAAERPPMVDPARLAAFRAEWGA